MNGNVFYVRIWGRLIPVNEVSLVQVSPNDAKKVVQEIPLIRPLEDLIEYNLNSFVKIHSDRQEWLKEMNGEEAIPRTERD